MYFIVHYVITNYWDTEKSVITQGSRDKAKSEYITLRLYNNNASEEGISIFYFFFFFFKKKKIIHCIKCFKYQNQKAL